MSHGLRALLVSVAILGPVSLDGCDSPRELPRPDRPPPSSEAPADTGHSGLARIGSFAFAATKGPLTDEVMTSIWTQSVTGAPGLLEGATLTWRCEAGLDVELYLLADEAAYESDPDVRWRLDESPASVGRPWAAGGTVRQAPDEVLLELTDGAMNASHLIVRLGGRYTYGFQLDGLRAALAELSCSLDPIRERVAARQRARERERERRADSIQFVVENPFVGSRASKTFVPTGGRCDWRRMFPVEASRVFFDSAEEAELAGYRRQC